MNRTRRSDSCKIRASLEALMPAIYDAIADTETLRDEETESLENLPESLQLSEQGQNMQAAVNYLETAVEELQQALNVIEAATDALMDAESF